jgi:L-fucose mutarotase/ribose pyranase (RbsD/FucU family)
MCFVLLSEETVPFALYIINRLDFITEAKSVYCEVRTEALYKTDTFLP